MLTALGFVLAVLVGVALGFFGGGGSILTVPLLVYVFALDPKEAIASSLLVVALASISGAVQHWRVGNVRVGTALAFGTAGMAGAYLGGRAGAQIDGRILLLLFAAMMILTATAMWRGRRLGAATPTSPSRSAPRLVLQGLAVGSFTGLVGAGGGFLIVPALVLWAELSPHVAVGTSLFVIVMQTVAGFAGYATRVAVDYWLIARVAGAAVIGSWLGVRLASVVPPASLRRAFAAFVMAMGVLILVRQGALVIEMGRAALPATLPQLAFALAMLAIGLLAGRVSRGASGGYVEAFEGGEGI